MGNAMTCNALTHECLSHNDHEIYSLNMKSIYQWTSPRGFWMQLNFFLFLLASGGLLATVQSRRLSLFGHIAQMSDESDAKQILTAFPLENWKRPPGRRHTMWCRTWNQWTSPSVKQLTQLRIGDWCLRLVLRTDTDSCACQKWMNEWAIVRRNPGMTLVEPLGSAEPQFKKHWSSYINCMMSVQVSFLILGYDSM